MIAKSFYTYLHSQIGSTPVFPIVLPENYSTWPAITYTQDDNADEMLLSSAVGSLHEARFQVDVWDKSYLTAHTTADLVSAALVGYSGAFGNNTADHIRKEREIDLFETDTLLHRVSLQFYIAYV